MRVEKQPNLVTTALNKAAPEKTNGKTRERKALTPAQKSRAYILGAVLLLVAAGFWWSLRSSLGVGLDLSRDTVQTLSVTFILFGWLLALIALAAAFIRQPWWGFCLLSLTALIHFVFFPWTYYSWAAVVLAVVIWLRFWLMVDEEAENRIRFNLIKVVTHGLGTAVTFTVLVIAISYLSLNSVSNQSGRDMTQRIIDSTSETILSLFKSQLKDFNRQDSLDTFLTRYGPTDFQNALPGGIVPTEYSEKLLVEAERAELDNLEAGAREAVLRQVRLEFLKPFGITAEGTEPLETVVHRAVQERLEPALKPFENWVPPILALALFSALSILGGVFYWWAVLWAAVAYGLLRWLKLIQPITRTETVSAMELRDT